MRSVSLAVLLVLAVAIVLVSSVKIFAQERERLRQTFVTSREADVRELASDLEDRLRDVEEDTRVIEALVGRTYVSAPDREDRTRTLRASFTAMATVIRHYRTLVLVSPGSFDPLVEAVDPTEEPAIARALVEMSCASTAGTPRLRGLTGPTVLSGGRAFYLYRFPAGLNEVVVSLDGPVFLQSAFRSISDGHIIVTDPWGVEWSRSSDTGPLSIRPPAERSPEESRWTGATGSAWLDPATSQRLNFPAIATAAVWAPALPGSTGMWRVVLIRPARHLSERERVLRRQVILTATSLLIALGVVGTLVVRQQRYSAALADRLRSAEALRSLERQLISAEKLATTGVLAAGIAHEVGTPLGIIRARAELLLDDIDGAESRRALKAIVDQIDRISSIIRQVLDFSRVQPVELGQVDLARAIPATLDLLGHRFRQQGITADADIAPDLPLVAADPNQLQQVLINLLLNACDACANGGQIRVAARRAEAGKRVQIDVQDTGAGIAPEHLLAVFDPFFTTKKRGEGTGLGLPIAASIVRNHGGDITLTSTGATGTTVTVRWPAALDGSDA